MNNRYIGSKCYMEKCYFGMFIFLQRLDSLLRAQNLFSRPGVPAAMKRLAGKSDPTADQVEKWTPAMFFSNSE